MAEFKPGDFVKIIGQGTTGEVLSVKDKDLEVAIGSMKIMVKKNKVEHTSPPVEMETRSIPSATSHVAGIDTREKLQNFRFELDVRGKMKEEVMIELPEWADTAILLGITEAKIIHGRGNGIMKNTVRSVLRKYKEIDSLQDGPVERGGDGMTVVKFKV